jgi:hypothetical protein
VSVLDAFFSTWSKAKATFGQGTPQGGAQYDKSGVFQGLQSNLDAAAPGSRWTGRASTAYGAANTEHQRVLGELGGLDKRLAAHVDQSAEVVSAGRRDLDAVRKWVVDAAASAPQNAAGERMLMPIAQKGIGQVTDIVQRTNDELDSIGGKIRGLGDEYQALGNQRFAKEGPLFGTGNGDKKDPNGSENIRGVDYNTGGSGEPLPKVPGQPVDPTNPFIGDQRFGQWENVVAPPYAGATPPPLKPEYRPFPDGTPLKTGGTTGWYTPGKSWIGDIDPPYAQLQEEYRFRMAGTEATTYTRVVYDNGAWHQQRWVQNVYEYQKNTQLAMGGDISVKGTTGDIGGLPTIPKIDYQWKPISPSQIASLSANNMEVTYYLPDGCGGQFTYQGGVPVGGNGGLPPSPPIMTRPR